MKFTVKLFANFRTGRFILAEQEHPTETSIAEVIASLGIEMKEIGMIMLNGRHAPPETVLREADVLALFPLLGGG